MELIPYNEIFSKKIKYAFQNILNYNLRTKHGRFWCFFPNVLHYDAGRATHTWMDGGQEPALGQLLGRLVGLGAVEELVDGLQRRGC